VAGELITIRCACGWETTGTETDVMTATSDHGRSIHNMTPTRAEVLAMAVPTTRPGESPVQPDPGEP
jgi:hypothetical protein